MLAFFMNSSTFLLGAAFLPFSLYASISPETLLTPKTAPQDPEALLEAPLKASLNLFQTLSEKAAKAYCGIDYASKIGTSNQAANLFPPTPYSRLKHLSRALKAFLEYAKVDLPESVVNDMKRALLTDEHALYAVLQRLNEIIPQGFKYPLEIQFLLENKPDLKQQGPLPITLPEALRQVHEPLFSLWRENVTYAPESESGFNLFARLNQLKTLTAGRALTPSEAEALGAPIGTSEDATNSNPMGPTPTTLFGKAVLAQKIVTSVLAGTPSHFPRIHHLLTHPQCSIGAALDAAVELVQGTRTEPLRHTVANRLDELHAVWKKDVADRLLFQPRHWPRSCALTTLGDLIEALSQKLTLVPHYVENADEVLSSLRAAFLPFNEDGTVELSGILAALVTRTRMLRIPSFMIDDRGAQTWIETIGNIHETTPRTLFGIANTIANELRETVTLQTLETVRRLVGSPKDAPVAPNDPNRTPTFWSLVNHLAAESLKSVYPQEALIEHIDALENAGGHEVLVDRLHQMDAAVRQIFKDNAYLGAEHLIDVLVLEGPRLLAALNTLSDPHLPTAETDAWWDPASNLYAPLNRILSAALFSEASTVIGDVQASRCVCPQKEDYAFEDLASVLRTTQTNLNAGLVAPKNKDVELKLRALIAKLGGTEADFSRSLETVSKRLAFLQEALPLLASILETPKKAMEALLGERDLKTLFDELRDCTTHLTPENLDWAVALLRDGDPNHPETIPAHLTRMTNDLLMALFGLVIDPYRAPYDGFTLHPRAALRCDLQTLRQTLERDKTVLNEETFRRLGGPWDGASGPTVFGRLVAVEEALLRRQNTALPVEAVLRWSAQFLRRIRDIAREGWTERTAEQIGAPDDAPVRASLFGALNGLLNDVLVAPAVHILDATKETLGRIENQIRVHEAPEDPAYLDLLRRIEAMSSQLPSLSNALGTLAGFLRPRASEQVQTLAQQLFCETQNLARDIEALLDSGEGWRLLLERLEKGANGGASIPALEEALALKLHALFLPLRKVCTSDSFEKANAFLEQYRQRLRPGPCNLYYVTDALRAIGTAASRISSALQSTLAETKLPAERALPPEAARAFEQTTNRHLDALTASIRSLSETMQPTSQALPRFLGKGAVPHDLSDVLADFADEMTQAAQTTEALVEHLGYAVPHAEWTPSPTWDHAALSVSFDEMNAAFDALAQTITQLAQTQDRWGALVSDPSAIGLKVAFQGLELKSLIPSLKAIRNILRAPDSQNGTPLCSGCATVTATEKVEVLASHVEQLGSALSALSHAFEAEAQTGLLRRSERALAGAFETTDGIALTEIVADWPSRMEKLETQINAIMKWLGLSV